MRSRPADGGPLSGPPSCLRLWLAWGELGVGGGRGQVGGGGAGGEADHRAVYVDAGRAVGGGRAGGRAGKRVTGRLTSPPAEPWGAGWPVAGSTPVSRSGRVAARLKTWFSSIWRVFSPSLTALGVHRPSWASHSGL